MGNIRARLRRLEDRAETAGGLPVYEDILRVIASKDKGERRRMEERLNPVLDRIEAERTRALATPGAGL